MMIVMELCDMIHAAAIIAHHYMYIQLSQVHSSHGLHFQQTQHKKFTQEKKNLLTFSAIRWLGNCKKGH